MALTERLQILVTADAKGAAREFDRIGASADKNLGRAEGRLDKVGASLTSFGTQAVVAAGVVGAGLFKVAESASAYGEQVSRAAKTFGDEALPALEEFAKGAADTAGISQTAALNAASAFSGFGRQLGKEGESLAQFSSALVQSAGDFASFADVTSDEALTIFQSTLAGETEAIRRYGIDVSAAALEQEALAQGVNKSSAEMTEAEKITYRLGILNREGALWAGDFADTSDSLANRQRNLAAEFENVKVALGEGLLPFAETAIGAIGGLVESFNGLSDENQNLIGSLAGWATLGAGVAGSLSLIGGQAIKLKDRFTVVTGTGAEATRSLNNLGKAAAGLTGLTIGVGVVTALYDITNAGKDAEVQLNKITTALNQGDESTAFDELIEQTRRLDGGVEDVLETIARLPQALNPDYAINIGQDEAVDLFDLKTALEQVTSAEEGLALVQEARRRGISGSSEAVERANTVLDEAEDRFKAAERAAESGNDANEEYAGGISEVEEEASDAVKVLGDYGKALEGAIKPVFEGLNALDAYSDAERDVAEAQKDVADARADLNSTAEEEADRLRDIEDAARSVDDAYRSLFDAQRNLLKERRDLARIDEDLAEANAELAGITPGTVEYDAQAEDVKNLTRRREDAVFSLESALLREEDAQRGIQDALRDQADTYKDVNESKDEGADAAAELAEAEENLADKQRALAEAAIGLQEELVGMATQFAEQGYSADDAREAILEWASGAPPEVQAAVASMGGDLDILLQKFLFFEALRKRNTAEAATGGTPFRDNIFGLGPKGRLGSFTGRGNRGPTEDAPPNPFTTNLRDEYAEWYRQTYGGERALGGSVNAGSWYMVNERGAELFAPDRPGFVMNASDASDLISGVNDLLNPQSIPDRDKALAASMESLVAQVNQGRSGTVIEQGAITVVAPRPEEAAVATVRKMRSSEFLAGGVR